MDYVRIGADAERIALRRHVADGLYPEYVQCVMELQMAIVLCTCGHFTREVRIGSETHVAGLVVAALDLEDFVYRRQLARWN